MSGLSHRQITKNTWVIEGGGGYSNCYVLDADNPIMIDSGISKQNVRAYAEEFLKKPVTSVINTHGHFDHTANNGYFDEVYMHELAAGDAKKKPAPFLFASYSVDYKITYAANGHVFDMGNRVLEVIEIGAHSPGSIAILDRTNRILFTGDEAQSGQVLLVNLPKYSTYSQTVERHLRNMRTLKKRESEFDIICPGHNNTPLEKGFIKKLIEIDKRILNGEEGEKNAKGAAVPIKGGKTARRFDLNGACICYDINRIKDTERLNEEDITY